MSYNVLANCYSDTAAAKEHLFSHCPLEYLDFRYRRILLVHEIKSNFFTIYFTIFLLKNNVKLLFQITKPI